MDIVDVLDKNYQEMLNLMYYPGELDQVVNYLMGFKHHSNNNLLGKYGKN